MNAPCITIHILYVHRPWVHENLRWYKPHKWWTRSHIKRGVMQLTAPRVWTLDQQLICNCIDAWNYTYTRWHIVYKANNGFNLIRLHRHLPMADDTAGVHSSIGQLLINKFKQIEASENETQSGWQRLRVVMLGNSLVGEFTYTLFRIH